MTVGGCELAEGSPTTTLWHRPPPAKATEARKALFSLPIAATYPPCRARFTRHESAPIANPAHRTRPGPMAGVRLVRSRARVTDLGHEHDETGEG